MFENALEHSVKRIKKGLETFETVFPHDQSEDYVYKSNEHYPWKEGFSWTEGFWTGMQWHVYEMTGDEAFKNIATKQLDFFKERLINKKRIDMHDLGFLYSLSCVAAYKLTGNTDARETAIGAAKQLATRFHKKGEFIQAWGEKGAKDNYRLIIDCLMNIPLLFWAAEETGEERLREIARKHLRTSLKVLIRDDFTTYHTFFFDYETGEPLEGVTHQGFSNDSCWARGQAWGVYGTALAYAYTKDETIIPIFEKLTECFISKLPKDNVPYWDMIFTEGDEPRDTSAATIAICGILEMEKYVHNEAFYNKAVDMMKALSENYLTDENSNGILTCGMYSRPHQHKPECNIWGDYFFVEAINRLNNPDWIRYW